MWLKDLVDRRNFEINRVIRYFIITDLLFIGGWGFIGPVFSIFIVDEVRNASIVTVGIVTALYWVLKSFLQVPIALYIDRRKGEKDDYAALLLGLFLAGCAAFSFVFARSVPFLLGSTILQSVAFALYIPAWSAIFSRHLDKSRYALEWSLNSTSLGLASGATALLSGVLVKFVGFNSVFILAALLSFVGVIFLLFLPDITLPSRSSPKPIIKDHSPKLIQH